MNNLKTNEKLNTDIKKILKQSNLHLIFLGLTGLSFLGFFIFHESGLKYIFGHTAALGIMGFYGGLCGVTAQKKGYKYSSGFKIGFIVPIILGTISAFLLGSLYSKDLTIVCGGWIALASGIITIIIISLIKKREMNNSKTNEKFSTDIKRS